MLKIGKKAILKMHLTPNGCVSPINRDHTSIFMNIKVCVKPIRNARILSCMLRFRIGFRLALLNTILFLRSDVKSRIHAGNVIYYF
jgi:hypothetical protein